VQLDKGDIDKIVNRLLTDHGGALLISAFNAVVQLTARMAMVLILVMHHYLLH
jgi:hypothetical protein